MSGAYPVGYVRLFSDDGREAFYSVPASVARAMQRIAREQGQLAPSGSAPRYRREEIFRLMDQTTTSVAKERVLALLKRRDYTSRELVARLVSEGYSEKLASLVVKRAQEVGYVSDERFVQSFVRSKLASGWGMVRIACALEEKGIATDELAGWPDAYIDPEAELERAIDVASHKRVSEPNGYEKMVRFLMGRGFGCAIAKKAAARTFAEAR